MKMRFRCEVMTDAPEDTLRHVRAAEDAGFEATGLSDSQSVYRELYVSMTLSLLKTRRIIIGPRVTNPVTRHPAVTASALATLDELAPGRVFMGIGTGNSALYNLSTKGAGVGLLRDYVLAVRGLLTTGEAVFQGQHCRLTWGGPRHIPMYIAAHGPKALRLAGEVADGVIIGLGLTREAVRVAKELVREGAVQAGRDPEQVELWWYAVASIGESRQAALDAMRMALAPAGLFLIRFTTEGKLVPPDIGRRLAELHQRYDFGEHFRPDARKNAQLVEELGLKEYLAERYALAGSPEECVEQVQRAAEAGADRIWMSVPLRDRASFYRVWGSRVMPAFQ